MDRLREELHEARAELEQKETEIYNVRTQWRQAISELNKLKAREKSVSHATDQQISGKVEHLRYEIRNFAFQHFESQLSEERVRAAVQSMSDRLRLPSHRIRGYLTSPTRRTLMIRSYVWLVLIEKVAGLYYWYGSRTYEAMQTMDALLYPEDGSSTPSNKDLQKWNEWRVMTTRLICDAKNGNIKEPNISNTKLFKDLVNVIYVPLSKLTRTPKKSLRQHLSTIMRQFLDLDRTLSIQVAEYDWEKGSQGERDPFTESTMVLELGEQLQMQPQRIALVLAPGLMKYGNSYGDNYDRGIQLVKMEVSCLSIRSPRRAHRKPPKQGGFRSFWRKICN